MDVRVTSRESEVLALVGAHRSNADIAAELHLSVRTVENHVSSLLRKYEVADRHALSAIATRTAESSPSSGRIMGAPVKLSAFIGRQAERDLVLSALAEARLVTLVGPGGGGKTRLAAAIAETAGRLSPEGGAFVDLVPVRDGYVAQAVAAMVGVTESPQQALADAIAGQLGDSQFLLILDNCEQVIDAVAVFVDRLLAVCPKVRVLATSRERLGVPGERIVRLPPLPLGTDAEALFVDRAIAADPEFVADPATVTEICRRLDGIPLAIELAAARSAALGASGLLGALDDSLRLLSGGRGLDPRHRSLRAVLDWSFDLLDEQERQLFRELSVFVGRFDLNAATTVSKIGERGLVTDLLGRLVDKNLLTLYRGTVSNWQMLQTIRTFASELLHPAPEFSATRQRHLEWAVASAVELQTRLDGRWFEEFDRIADDLRAAMANSAPGPDPLAHKLAQALGRLTFARRFLVESLSHFTMAASRASNPADASRDLRDAAGCAHFLDFSGDRAVDLLLAAAEQSSVAGDGNEQAIALARAVEIAARYPGGHRGKDLNGLLDQARSVGNPTDLTVAASLAAAQAWSLAPVPLTPDPDLAAAAEDAARATGDPALITGSLDAVRTAATATGRLREAHRISTIRLGLLNSLDHNDPRVAVEIEDTYNMAATDAIAAGDLRSALAVGPQLEQDNLVAHHPYLTTSKMIPALVLSGRFEEAIGQADRMWQAWQRAGSPPAGWTSPAMSATALAHCLLGDEASFRLWRDRALEIAGTEPVDRNRHATFASFVDSRAVVHTGVFDEARDIVHRAFHDLPSGWYQSYALAAAAELAAVAGLPEVEDLLAIAISAADQNDWASACVARAAGRLHTDSEDFATSIQGWRRIGADFELRYTEELLRTLR